MLIFKAKGRDYPGAPFSTGRTRDDCSPMKKGGRKSVCNGNIRPHHAPLCYCASAGMLQNNFSLEFE